ncbi:MAG: hypothetical protein Q7T55_17850 [Solirubrobacteraceae bacterium]|nr:hypothetical protein [Solirubrobacteraceae bacterium]
MSPFQESETFPRGRRVLLIPVALLFLIGPYGSMLDGGPSDPLRWTVTMICIALCTAILALGLAPPRRRVVIDPEAGTIRISATPPPPHFLQVHEDRPIDDVTDTEIVEFGVARSAGHGYRVVISFESAPPLHLKVHRDRDRAQRTIEHLVLLGLPGDSHLRARNAQFDAEKPTTWL